MHPITMAIFQAYCERLANLDWFYDYSDDGRVWRAGLANYNQAKEAGANHPILTKVWNIWCAYIKDNGMPDRNLAADRIMEREIAINQVREQLAMDLANYAINSAKQAAAA